MNTSSPLDVLVVGDLFLELVMSGFASWPHPGEESFAKQFHKEVGGGAAITACGLSKLGLRAAVLGVVGRHDGQWMLQQLNTRGVDTSHVRVTSAEPTAFTVSVSSTLDRALFTYPGANRELPGLLSEMIGIGVTSQVRHIHLAHALDPANARAVLRTIKDRHWSVSLDVGWHPEWFADPRAIAALRLVDIVFPNEHEAETITGEREPVNMLNAFQRLGLKRVALKLGRNGAALLWDGEISFHSASPIDAVDTTGAGDCFDAGFLYAWLHDMDPKLCLKAGAACGELSTRALGGVAGFPSREELEAILCIAK